jgi:hypothetical protein
MKYTADTKPGMADPNWYEWSVGQSYLVDMLNPDNHIKYVELQADVQLGLDDIVITYDDERTRFIQVKHTRVDDTLTFGDLVSVKKSENDTTLYCSLLGELARSWNLEKDKYTDSEVYIYTNRKVGIKASAAGKGRKIKRPPLKDFWSELQEKTKQADSFSDLDFPQNEEAWKEWCEQLAYIEKDDDKLLFLKKLHIETDKESLEALVDSIKHKLQVLFTVSVEASDFLLGKLDHALREWTTSRRRNAKISKENVYSALSVAEETISYNHDLIPVSPFFTSRQELVSRLEEDLFNSEAKIFFLSGVPGTGKTNIISHLCSKKDSIIDIRYYAYEPIDPTKEYLPLDVSDRVKKEVFWDTLLNQTRELLEGHLYQYKVPVSNAFLTLEGKKNEFIRIASEYARDRKRIFIIAIDGLDHAARAGVIEDTFLQTLPHPENLPDNVKVIIAGQPKEDYLDYPDWLYQASDIVKEYIVPDIQSSDIKNLVEEKCRNFDASNRRIVSDIICRYAGGNTLAAIFAVHEALNSQNPSLFEEKLKARKLGGNIQEYYHYIWETVKRKMQVQFVDYKMAGVFAFFNEPISASKLSMIFKEEGISVSSWNNILKALRPLLTENNGFYTILHNDVRVYLSGIIGRDQDHVKEVYSGLADYYISQDEKSIGYYRDVIRFLISANRLNEFALVYTPEYIINAYVKGVDLSELANISNEIMQNVINAEKLDWDSLRSLALGYLTIEQIQKCTYEIEDVSFRNVSKSISVHPYECNYLSADKWSTKIVSEVLQLTKDLFDAGEVYRGKTLFMGWFGDVRLSDFQKLSKDEDYYSLGADRNIPILLGKACVNSTFFRLFENASTYDEDSFLLDVIEKVEEEILDKLHSDSLSKALRSLDILLIDPLIGGIKNMLEYNRYEDLAIIRNTLQERNTKNPISLMMLSFLKIITEEADWEISQDEILWKKIESVKMPDDNIENLMSYYSMYGIVSAYLQNKSRSVVAQEITDLYIGTHKHQSSKYFLLYFNAVAFLGKWIKAKNEKQGLSESINDLKQIIENLYCKQWNLNEIDYESVSLRAHILKAYIMLSEDGNAQIQTSIRESLERVFKKNPVNQLLDPGMYYYRGRPERMQQWIDEWLAEGGKTWSEAIGDRNSIVKKFVEIKEKYDKNNVLNLRGAVDRIQWSVIGFVSHKEYCVDFLLNWYNNLVDRFPEYIPKYGIEVKEISDMIEVLGDNRMEYSLNSKIYSDWGSMGDSNIREILQDRRLFAQCISQPSYIVDILIGYLKKDGLDRQQLLMAWSAGIGFLDWRNEDDHGTISALQRAIEVASVKNVIVDIKQDLTRLGPAYIDLSGDPVKYIIPERWCDKGYKSSEIDNPEELLFKYTNNTISSLNHSDVTKALRTLYSVGKLSEEIIDQVLDYELSSDNYGIRWNSVLEFLFEVANDKTADEYIRRYICSSMEKNRFYPEQDLPAIIGWRLKNKKEEYIEGGLISLIDTFKCWITASDHISVPDLEDGFDYSKYVNFGKNDVFVCLTQILLLVLISDDADAARVALGGIAALLRTNIDYISLIEGYWNRLHYRAKEWVLMVYEFVYSLCPEHQKKIYACLVNHSTDDDFNAALYSKLLCENANPEFDKQYSIEKKTYFSLIPSVGQKRLIKTQKKGPWINGTECVLEQLSLLENRIHFELEDIERRTADYTGIMTDEVSLVPIYRQKAGGCKVVCEKVNMAYYRVLYKDWYEGRWRGVEAELARVILSASEPFTLLLSPYRWKWNEGKLFDKLNDMISASEKERSSNIDRILETGISSDEVVLAGSIEDYTYSQRLFGFLLGYLDVPNISEQYALSRVERNARIFLKKRNDYVEEQIPSLTIHQNGIESFKQSNIMCGFRKSILSIFKWKTKICIEGIELVNSNDKIVGRLECFYAFRTDMGNKYPSNQPYIQRWIVKKKTLQEAVEASGCPFKIKCGVGSVITGSEY